DEIVLREEGHEAVEAFLDPFNHRAATLLYRAWKKYRYPERFRAGGVDDYSRSLLCLAGFGWGDKPLRAGLPNSRVLGLLGLLTQRTRTSEGLAGVVALAAPGVEVRVDEFWAVTTSTGRPTPLTSAKPDADVLPDEQAYGVW
ncbi:type VI secretion system baseplate subunit TssG, partial [Pseudomonas sp. MWU13-2860]